MPVSKYEVASIALGHLGLVGIQSFSNESDAEELAAETYETYINEFLSAYPWDFAKRQIQLARDDNAPVTRWRYRYALPSRQVMVGGPHAVYNVAGVGASPYKRYEVMSDSSQRQWLYTDADLIIIVHSMPMPEQRWPAHFTSFVTAALAARWAMSLTEDLDLAKYWQMVAFGDPVEQGRGGLFRSARQTDSMTGGTQAFEDYTLIAARAGGG